jgi:hypothetical protein
VLLILFPATRSHTGAASQAALGFHVVSWDQLNTSFDLGLLLSRNSIINLWDEV